MYLNQCHRNLHVSICILYTVCSIVPKLTKTWSHSQQTKGLYVWIKLAKCSCRLFCLLQMKSTGRDLIIILERMRGTSSHGDLKLRVSLCLGHSSVLKVFIFRLEAGKFLTTIAKPKAVSCHACHYDPQCCLQSWRPYSDKWVILSAESQRKGSLKDKGLSSSIVRHDLVLPIFFLRNFELHFCHAIVGTSTELILQWCSDVTISHEVSLA